LNDKKMAFPDPAVDISLTGFNGVNSKFQIDKPIGGKILALKYLISNIESGTKKTIENGLSEAVYVPYSQDFAAPEVLAYGADYINGIISQAAIELKDHQSFAVPGENMTQAIPPSLIKALVYAEHTDTNQVLNSNNPQGTIDQLNILFALNEGDAYKYSVSSAGARGIAQFLPTTYGSLAKRHPEAELIPDFASGMSDHENSIKAMYLLLDDYAGTVRLQASQGFAAGRVFDYGAASYNAGTPRVAKAVNMFGASWNENRNELINSLQQQVNNLTAQAKSLKKKVTAAKDKKTKTALQAQLTAAQSDLNSTTKQLTDTKAASLRVETVTYLQKIYKVINIFNSEPQNLAFN
jgi:hypothetical protein